MTLRVRLRRAARKSLNAKQNAKAMNSETLALQYYKIQEYVSAALDMGGDVSKAIDLLNKVSVGIDSLAKGYPDERTIFNKTSEVTSKIVEIIRIFKELEKLAGDLGYIEMDNIANDL